MITTKQELQLLYWIAYTVVVPVGFIGIVWAFALVSKSPNWSFGEVFGTGDLLPLAAVLLLSCSADIRMAQGQNGFLLAAGEVVFLLLGVLAVFAFGLVKMRGVELLRAPDTEKAEAGLVLAAFAKMSWAYVLAAVTMTIPAKVGLVLSETPRV